jgi:intraflagellar transport protein 20
MSSDIVFDEHYHIRILDPVVYKKSEALQSESREFADKMATVMDVATGTLKQVAAAAASLEREKLKAIGMRNKVESQAEIRKQRAMELESLVAEKKQLLDRKLAEYQCLLNVEREQAALIERLSQSSM